MVNKQDKRPPWAKALALFTLIVSDLTVLTALGAGIGYLLSESFGWNSWIQAIGILVGFLLGVGHLIWLYKTDKFDKFL